MRGSMVQSFLRRLLYALIAIVGVAALVFILLRMVPGNPVATLLGEHADSQTVERISSTLGLDQPLPVQFANYLLGALHGDFGESYTLGKPVAELIGPAFVNTLWLALGAALVAWVVGIACGLIVAVYKSGIIDRLFMGFSLLGVSLPVFMVAMLLQYLFARYLHWLPVAGVSDWTGYILPAIALGWSSAGSIARLVRSSVIDVLQQDYTVSALDVSVQNQILNLLHELQEERGLTYVFISHDLSVVRHISDRICVMFLGKVMEMGPAEEVFCNARHPYTQFLLDSVLLPDPHRRGQAVRLLKGEPPSPVNPPSGCCFRTRCPFATDLCSSQEPSLRSEGSVEVACHHLDR